MRHALTHGSQWDTLTPTGVPGSEYTFTGTTPSCPASSASGSWTLEGNAPLPTIKNLVIPTKTLSGTGDAIGPIAVSTSNGQLISATNAPLPSNSPSSSSGISTGDKAAIGVVVPIFIIASALVALWLWLRKKNAREASDPGYRQVQGMQDVPEWGRTELGGGEIAQLHSHDARPEVDGRTRYQLSDEAAVTPELTATAAVEPHELSTGPSVRRNPKNRMSYE